MPEHPYRSCDYCKSRLHAEEPWCILPNTRKLSCPDCMPVARQEDELASAVIRQYRHVLELRLVAEKAVAYGDPLHARMASIKAKHPGVVLLFHIGDHYIAMGADALLLHERFHLATCRVFAGGEVQPQVSFPHPALEVYLPALVRDGHRVGICGAFHQQATSAVAEPFGDVPLPRTHQVWLRSPFEILYMHLAHGRFYSLDGTWHVDAGHPSILRVQRVQAVPYAEVEDGAGPALVSEPMARKDSIDRKRTQERLAGIIRLLHHHHILPITLPYPYCSAQSAWDDADQRLTDRHAEVALAMRLIDVTLDQDNRIHFTLEGTRVSMHALRVPEVLQDFRHLCNNAGKVRLKMPAEPPRHAVGNFTSDQLADQTLRYAETNLETARQYRRIVPELAKLFAKHLEYLQAHDLRQRLVRLQGPDASADAA